MNHPMYLLPFRKQYGDYDLSLISESLKKFYPVGSAKRLTAKAVSSAVGFKKRGEIIEAEFLHKKDYEAKWGKLTAHLKRVFKKPVYGYPDLYSGGFLGEVILSEDKQPAFVREKVLQFNVGTIGPFFSIFGVDRSTAMLWTDSSPMEPYEGNFEATHALTISPIYEYGDTFKTLEEELRAYFPGYRFVPYDVGMSTKKYISIADDLEDSRIIDTIYQGIYGNQAVYSCLTRGDGQYGLKDWVRQLNKKEQSLINLISQHIVNAPTGITINKVWKLLESKRLDTFQVSGSLMLGIEMLDVIDLTDQSSIIMMSQTDRRSVAATKYKIFNDTIKLNEILSLKIISFTEETLSLHLIIDLAVRDASTKGPAVEMKFMQMKKPIA